MKKAAQLETKMMAAAIVLSVLVVVMKVLLVVVAVIPAIVVTGAAGALAGPGDVVEVSAVSMRAEVPMDALAPVILTALSGFGVENLADMNANSFAVVIAALLEFPV